MSEYQYYEFLAIDRPLTPAQMEAVRAISTRAEITAVSFTNEYHFGDFKGDPNDFLRRYYDAMVYLANWGTRRFMFRVPKELVDLKVAEQYVTDESLDIHPGGNNVIFDISSNDEDGGDWEEGRGWMASLSRLREEVISGDLRPLFIAWLIDVQSEMIDDDEPAPPIPPGLAKLTPAQKSLAEFLRLDRSLLNVAARHSGPLEPPKQDIARFIAALPAGRKDQALLAMCNGSDPQAVMKLRREFAQAQSRMTSAPATQAAFTVGEWRKEVEHITEVVRQETARCKAEEKARRDAEVIVAREKYLHELAGRQDSAWTQVDLWIRAKLPKLYEQSVDLLCDLRDVAQMEKTGDHFAKRMAALVEQHSRKPALIERFRKAGLTAG